MMGGKGMLIDSPSGNEAIIIVHLSHKLENTAAQLGRRHGWMGKEWEAGVGSGG